MFAAVVATFVAALPTAKFSGGLDDATRSAVALVCLRGRPR
jgi:hypothetical protein